MPSTIKRYPVVALVGRTNVGKSTLFNRLIEEKKALVSPLPNTTRDRLTGTCLWRGEAITVVDTGGQDIRPETDIESSILVQAMKGAEEADAIVFIADGETGPLPADRAILKKLYKLGKPLILAVNKTEKVDARSVAALSRFAALRLGEPIAISGATGIGVGDLLDAVYDALIAEKKFPKTERRDPAIKIAIIGKPNVGKSSLINAIVKEERCIVSPTPHTTREPEDIEVCWKDKNVVLVDTAGMRRTTHMKNALVRAGIQKTEEMIQKADMCFLLLDATGPIENEDKRLAGMIFAAKKGCAIIVTKWDTVPEKGPDTINHVTKFIRQEFPFFAFAPIIFTSSATHQRVNEVLDLALHIAENRVRVIEENALEKFFKKTIAEHKPSRGWGTQHPYLFRMKQVHSNPPAFLITVKGRRESVHFSYLRFLENRLREKFDFSGTPIDIILEDVSL